MIKLSDSTPSQTTLALLKSGRRIHRYLNRDMFGSESLHSIISYLKNTKGYPIESRWVWRLDFTLNLKHVKEYFLTSEYLANRGVVLELPSRERVSDCLIQLDLVDKYGDSSANDD